MTESQQKLTKKQLRIIEREKKQKEAKQRKQEQLNSFPNIQNAQQMDKLHFGNLALNQSHYKVTFLYLSITIVNICEFKQFL